MKLNTEPMAMPVSAVLWQLLCSIFAHDTMAPNAVVETGTFMGTGSTQLLIRAIENSGRPWPMFHSIEVNGYHYECAKKNLAQWPGIQLHRGLSVNKEKALEFLKKDTFLYEDAKYPDLLKDTEGDPIAYYTQEIMSYDIPRDDLLKDIIPYCEAPVFFCLDSAGGLGLLEYETCIEAMGDRPFYMLLDDINHVKHYRSVIRLRERSDTVIMYQDNRVLLALRA